MALSYNEYTGDGSTQNYALTFGYIAKSHVKASVGGVDTGYTWVTNTQISLTSVPPSGATVRIYRETPESPLVTYNTGSLLAPEDLNIHIMQTLYSLQEYADSSGIDPGDSFLMLE